MSKKVTNIQIYNSKVKWKDCFDMKLVDNVIELQHCFSIIAEKCDEVVCYTCWFIKETSDKIIIVNVYKKSV